MIVSLKMFCSEEEDQLVWQKLRTPSQVCMPQEETSLLHTDPVASFSSSPVAWFKPCCRSSQASCRVRLAFLIGIFSLGSMGWIKKRNFPKKSRSEYHTAIAIQIFLEIWLGGGGNRPEPKIPFFAYPNKHVYSKASYSECNVIPQLTEPRTESIVTSHQHEFLGPN